MTYEQILTYFDVKSENKKQAQAICPCHRDTRASLTISRGRSGNTLIHCHANCKCEDILAAKGLSMRDLFDDSDRSGNADGEAWRKYVESREKRKIEAVYNYVSLADFGAYAFSKLRLDGKNMIVGRLENGRFSYGLPRNTPRKSLKAVYGNLQNIIDAGTQCKPVFIVEGEKDVDCLSQKGFAAWTYGSASDWRREFADFWSKYHGKFVVLADNDSAGLKVAKQIVEDFAKYGKNAIPVIVPTPDTPHGDISDFFAAGHTTEEFIKMVDEALAEGTHGIPTPLNKETTVTEKTVSAVENSTPISDLVQRLTELDAAKNFEINDKDNAALFTTIFKDRHSYNTTAHDFMYYDGSRWALDSEGLQARHSAKLLSDALSIYAQGQYEAYQKAVKAWCSLRTREQLIKDSRDLNFFSDVQLDADDFSLNVQNGVLDLHGDKPTLLPHSPEQLLSKVCNVEYSPEAACPRWEKFLDEIMEGDSEKVKYLQKIAGICLTGGTELEACFILYGKTTRNGKSTFVETLLYMLGDYGTTVRPETLAVKQNADSRTASGDIARLKGVRLANASEPPKRMLFDTALLKSLTGRDVITARRLYQSEFEFKPKFKLLMNTNYLPQINDDTVFSSGRINVISFDKHFSETEQDKNLKDELRTAKELSGILNWCIDGLRLYRREGLNPPKSVTEANAAYRQDSDKLGRFLSECMTKSDESSKAGDVYRVYAEWCEEGGAGVDSKSNFFSELRNKGLLLATGTVDGKTVKNVVRGYTIGFQEAENTPFD